MGLNNHLITVLITLLIIGIAPYKALKRGIISRVRSAAISG